MKMNGTNAATVVRLVFWINIILFYAAIVGFVVVSEGGIIIDEGSSLLYLFNYCAFVAIFINVLLQWVFKRINIEKVVESIIVYLSYLLWIVSLAWRVGWEFDQGLKGFG